MNKVVQEQAIQRVMGQLNLTANDVNRYIADAVLEHDLLKDEITSLRAEVERYKQWVSDLQSGMYVNCVYCGHRYGPGETTPVSMADALKRHVESCPEHPMSALKAEVERLRAAYEAPPTSLTLDDLKQMEGEPVYIQYGDGKEGWDHVEDGLPIWLESDPDFINMTCSFDKDGHFGLHVLGWQAFRRRPEAARAALEEVPHG